MASTTARALRPWYVPISIIVIAGLLIAVVVLQSRGPVGSDGAQGDTDEAPDLSYIETRDPDDLQSAGSVDAPVGLVVYSDFQCPFCAQWTKDTLPEMMTYAELGDLRIEWRDVNQYGENSERAARAAAAAARQDQYWEFHGALFPDGEHLPAEDLSEDGLIAVAEDLGLDISQFTEDMNSPEVAEEVSQYAAEGREIGVTGTPTFVLGGEPIVGAQPTDVFIDTLQESLVEARG